MINSPVRGASHWELCYRDPQFIATFSESARPKSEAWKKALSERLKQEWATGIRKNAFRRKEG
jgi:hypothetical protein